jgi:hypothetical protein
MLSLRAAVVGISIGALSCASLQPAPKLPPASVDCPAKQKSNLVYDAKHEVARRELDTNGDGRPDVTLFLEHERTTRAELDLDYDGATDLWLSFDSEERVVSWEEVTPARSSSKPTVASGRLPEDRPPPELARLIPGLDPPAPRECVERPEVADYLQDVKKRVYGRWVVPSSASEARTRLSFSLDQSGAVVGACVREADDPRVGQGIVSALFASAPFPAMPPEVRCLSRHHLIGTFVIAPSP